MALVARADPPPSDQALILRAQPTTQPALRMAIVPDAPSPDLLFGTWYARNVPSRIGALDLKLTLGQQGNARIIATSHWLGVVRDKRAVYRIRENMIESEVIKNGGAIRYWLDDQGRLVFQYKPDKTVAFFRETH